MDTTPLGIWHLDGRYTSGYMVVRDSRFIVFQSSVCPLKWPAWLAYVQLQVLSSAFLSVFDTAIKNSTIHFNSISIITLAAEDTKKQEVQESTKICVQPLILRDLQMNL